jgi:NAD(P)-dependent dehydrogenase (short-subunit alcohol dehydrogenase family)
MKLIKNLKKTINLVLADKVTASTPLLELKGKVVLVTGANKGIGNAIFEELYHSECKVALFVRNREKLQESLKHKDNDRLLVIEGDVQNFEDCKRAVGKTFEKFGKLDVLINNAGTFIEKPLEEINEDELYKMLNTNLAGVIQTSIAATKVMKKQGNGTIINIGSKISHNTNIMPNKTLYAATKYGVEGFSFALNKELKGTGCRCICLMPGTVNTFFSVQSGNYMASQRVAQIVAQVIKFEDIDFEGVVFKSVNQEI